jgi:hypothetical protein
MNGKWLLFLGAFALGGESRLATVNGSPARAVRTGEAGGSSRD